jgi:hypothetical protein
MAAGVELFEEFNVKLKSWSLDNVNYFRGFFSLELYATLNPVV